MTSMSGECINFLGWKFQKNKSARGAATPVGAHEQLSAFILHRQRRNEKMKFKRFLVNAITLAAFALIGWILISWVDVLMHNTPVYGDKQYMPANAFVVMVELMN